MVAWKGWKGKKKFGAGDYPTFGSCFTPNEARLNVLCRGIEQWLNKQETARNLQKMTIDVK